MLLKLFLKKYEILFRWWLLGPYYVGLLVQARFLYRQHFWFKERHKLLGLDFAENAFEQDAEYFLAKVKEEPLLIRLKIFWDATLGQEPKPYYL